MRALWSTPSPFGREGRAIKQLRKEVSMDFRKYGPGLPIYVLVRRGCCVRSGMYKVIMYGKCTRNTNLYEVDF